MIKKFNYFKESNTPIEQLKEDVEDLLIDLSDELYYKLGKDMFIYTKEEYLNSDDVKRGNITGYMTHLIENSKIIINIKPKHIYISKPSSLEKQLECTKHHYELLKLVGERLDRLNATVNFYRHSESSWYLYIE